LDAGLAVLVSIRLARMQAPGLVWPPRVCQINPGYDTRPESNFANGVTRCG
jgi:hypothetical protein